MPFGCAADRPAGRRRRCAARWSELVRAARGAADDLLPARGRPAEQVVAAAAPVELPVVDLAARPAQRREPQARRSPATRRRAVRPGAGAAAARPRWSGSAEDEHVLAARPPTTSSSTAGRSGCSPRARRALRRLAARRPSPLPALPIQYADFARLAARVAAGRVLAGAARLLARRSWPACAAAGAADRPAAPGRSRPPRRDAAVRRSAGARPRLARAQPAAQGAPCS